MLYYDEIEPKLSRLILLTKEAFAQILECKTGFQEDYDYTFIRFLIAIEKNYKAVFLLTKNNPENGGIANIINRSSLDAVFNSILIITNPQKYNWFYYKAGWRQEYEKFLRHKNDEFFIHRRPDWLDTQ